jgi:hypothetical protein
VLGLELRLVVWERHDCDEFAHLIAHEGFVRAERCRTLGYDSN